MISDDLATYLIDQFIYLPSQIVFLFSTKGDTPITFWIKLKTLFQQAVIYPPAQPSFPITPTRPHTQVSFVSTVRSWGIFHLHGSIDLGDGAAAASATAASTTVLSTPPPSERTAPPPQGLAVPRRAPPLSERACGAPVEPRGGAGEGTVRRRLNN
jgi:hypothetical protein